ncbi:MAG: hypothetical protein JWR19_3258 [Pedosphaera sp.]|nr:hypothetical protein [Pedosphaera sp.]
MKKLLLILMVAGVYVLHQDYWNWKSADLVFGFLPVGLAYHAGFSVVAAIMMAVLVKFAWPKHLEDVQPHDSAEEKTGEERRP